MQCSTMDGRSLDEFRKQVCPVALLFELIAIAVAAFGLLQNRSEAGLKELELKMPSPGLEQGSRQ